MCDADALSLQPNTFQLVIAYDPSRYQTFVMYIYKELGWDHQYFVRVSMIGYFSYKYTDENALQLAPSGKSTAFRMHERYGNKGEYICLFVYVSLSVFSCVRLSVCPSVRLSVCPSARLSVCPSVCLSVCPSVRLYVCPSVRLSVCPSVRLSVCPSVRLSVCPSVRLSVCPSVRLSVCPSVRLSVCPSVSPANQLASLSVNFSLPYVSFPILPLPSSSCISLSHPSPHSSFLVHMRVFM